MSTPTVPMYTDEELRKLVADLEAESERDRRIQEKRDREHKEFWARLKQGEEEQRRWDDLRRIMDRHKSVQRYQEEREAPL